MHAVYLPFPSLADRAGEDSLGLLAEGGPDSRTLSAIFFDELKNAVDPRRANVFPLFASPYPLRNCSDRSPTAWGDGRGEDSNVEPFPSQFSLSV